MFFENDWNAQMSRSCHHQRLLHNFPKKINRFIFNLYVCIIKKYKYPFTTKNEQYSN